MLRRKYLTQIEVQFRVHPICALLGPRQVGKTTLSKMYVDLHPTEQVIFFDLENPLDLARLDNPLLALSSFSKALIVIDEIQRLPDLFPILRVLVDDNSKQNRFLILGSASRDLIRQSSETLAGRIGYIEVMPFSLDEVDQSEKLWIRGGFPKSYLAQNLDDSYLWRQSYIATFLERDIPNLGFQIPAMQMRRFWLMLVHYHGQLFNSSEMSRSLGISDHIVRKYLNILSGTFMIRLLPPWFENLRKRQIKSPKIYFRDSGILNAFIGIKDQTQLSLHPRLGAFWEGFAMEEVIRITQTIPEECYFWGTQGGAELDLFLHKNGKRIGFEFKYSDGPKMTPSMKIAKEDLKLDHLFVVFPGKQTYPLAEGITVVGLDKICEEVTLFN